MKSILLFHFYSYTHEDLLVLHIARYTITPKKKKIN